MSRHGRKPAAKRSNRWPTVRRAFLAGQCCAVCGGSQFLEAHHCRPFHLFRALELDPRNLIALCEAPGHNCHLIFGHLGNWRSYNPHVRVDAAWWGKKIRHRPKPGHSRMAA